MYADAASRTTDALEKKLIVFTMTMLQSLPTPHHKVSADTKLEREAKNTIDEVMGGEVNYGKVCNAFVF